jgi:hypothetical protein
LADPAAPICFASPSPVAQQVIEGKLRGLAVTSKARTLAYDPRLLRRLPDLRC